MWHRGFYERPTEPRVEREHWVLRYKGARSVAVSGIPFHTLPWSLMRASLWSSK